MPYPFSTINNKLLPLRQYSEWEVNPFYAWAGAGTGLAGTLVTMTTFNPDNTDGFNTDAPMGTQPIPGMLSSRYETRNRFRASASGDLKWNVLGITLMDSREIDENDLPLRYFPQKSEEMKCVNSGQNVPVLQRGILTLRNDAYIGIPRVGYVGVIHSGGNGLIEAVNPTMLSETGDSNAKYGEKHVVGKFLSTTGSSFGGYAIFKLEL